MRREENSPFKRRKPVLKNRTAPEIEEATIKLAIEQPAFGQVRIANELAKRGLMIGQLNMGDQPELSGEVIATTRINTRCHNHRQGSQLLAGD